MRIKRILIIDHSPIVRKGLKELISAVEDLEVCAESSSAYNVQQLVEKFSPLLIVIDISMKEGCGIEFIKDMKNFYPDINILVFTQNLDVIHADHILRAGALGYLLKEDTLDNIIIALRQVLVGEIYVSEKIRHQLLKRLVLRSTKRNASPLELLSSREMEVFQLIGEGFSTKRIAGELGLGIKTIETYRFHIKKKLGLKDNTHLIQQAVRWSSGMQ